MNLSEHDKAIWEHLAQEIDDGWQVYEFHFIDWFGGLFPVFDVLKPTKANIRAIFKALELFENSAWEGDGEIQVGWIPGFITSSCDNTIGCLFWHVKQSNNGTSFIATKLPLKKFNSDVTQWFK